MNKISALLLGAVLLGASCPALSIVAVPDRGNALWTHNTVPNGGDYIYTDRDDAANGEFRWACDTTSALHGAFLFNGLEEEGRSYLKMARSSGLKQKEKLKVVWRFDGGKEHSGYWQAHYRWPDTAAALPTGVFIPKHQHTALLAGMRKGLKMTIRVENDHWQYHSSFSLKRFTRGLSELSCYK